jgi:HK97 family phage major capsid protein
MSIHELRAKRATALDPIEVQRKSFVAQLEALAGKPDFDPAVDGPEFEKIQKSIAGLDQRETAIGVFYDAEIDREIAALERAAKTALPVEGQETHRVPATVNADPYTSESAALAKGLTTHKALIIGGCARMIGQGGGNIYNARMAAKELYGENHPVTKALLAGVGASGGFIVPPDYVAEIIELLRPQAVVRSAGPRALPMPRGTLRLPSQTSAATASYSAEDRPIQVSQQKIGAIVASYKKLTALVPISNDLMRYADPAADAFVRDDLVKVVALREDLAFMLGDGTQDTPRGFISFANGFAVQTGGTIGVWSSIANSAFATGGNFITSNPTYTLATAASELGGAINRLDTANVPDSKRMWFMHPRSFNYLNNVQNSLGVYVYRDDLRAGQLLGYPFKKTTQIPASIWDATGTNKDTSFIMLVEMTDALLLDSMTLELAVSREGMYVDQNSVTQSAFQNDETLIRAIEEHDFQMRHDASVAVIQGVRYAPAIS